MEWRYFNGGLYVVRPDGFMELIHDGYQLSDIGLIYAVIDASNNKAFIWLDGTPYPHATWSTVVVGYPNNTMAQKDVKNLFS